MAPAPSANWPVLHYLLTKEGKKKSWTDPTPSEQASAPVVPVGQPVLGPGFMASSAPLNRDYQAPEVEGQMSGSSQGYAMSEFQVKVEPVDEVEVYNKSLHVQPIDQSIMTPGPAQINFIKMETGYYRCGSCFTDFPDSNTVQEHSRLCNGGSLFGSQFPDTSTGHVCDRNNTFGAAAGEEFPCRVCHITFRSAMELLSHLNTHR